MTQEEIDTLYQQLKDVNVVRFLREDDEANSLVSIGEQFKSALYWSKRFLNNRKYIDSLPRARVAESKQAIVDVVERVKAIENTRATDPTQFIRSKDTYITELDRALGDVYTKISEPFRNYLVYSRGKEVIDETQESLERIQDVETVVQSAKTATQEATAEISANTSAEYYNSLATEYSGKVTLWMLIFWVYTAILIFLLGLVAINSTEFKTALLSFDSREGILLKLAFLLLVGYSYSFIAKNYSFNQNIVVAAKTRKTILKTWRAFISAEELNTPESSEVKAVVTEIIAKQVFSALPLGLEKRSAKLVDNPVNVFTATKGKLDDYVDGK